PAKESDLHPAKSATQSHRPSAVSKTNRPSKRTCSNWAQVPICFSRGMAENCGCWNLSERRLGRRRCMSSDRRSAKPAVTDSLWIATRLCTSIAARGLARTSAQKRTAWSSPRRTMCLKSPKKSREV
ncbi:unnamed protein product, partial [Mycena citricolor]